MHSSRTIGLLLLALSVGGAGVWLVLDRKPGPTPPVNGNLPDRNMRLIDPSPPPTELSERLFQLEQEVAVLARELSDLRSLARREATPEVPELSESPPPATALLEIDPEAFARASEVYAARLRVEQEAERERQAEERILEKCAALAGEFGLTPPEEKILADILLAERLRAEAIEREAEARGPSPETKRWRQGENSALEDWKTRELAARLGAVVADRLGERRAGKGSAKKKASKDG